MREGWLGDDYLVFFSDSEISSATDKYGFETLLPGFEVLGLRGWDDFIVRDRAGKCFSVPTVPVDSQYLEAFQIPSVQTKLEQDSRFLGKIKWYTKPLAFGGDPGSKRKLRVGHSRGACQTRSFLEREISRAQRPWREPMKTACYARICAQQYRAFGSQS